MKKPPHKRRRVEPHPIGEQHGAERHSTTSGSAIKPVAKETWSVPKDEEKASRGGVKHKVRGQKKSAGDGGWGGRGAKAGPGKGWALSGANAVTVG